MNLDELRSVQASERESSSLQPLPDSFYQDVAAYLEGLRAERQRAAEQADAPFSSEEVRHLTDQIETATEVTKAIYDRRVGKVVKRASLAAAGIAQGEAGLTDEEAELFKTLVDKIKANRSAVLESISPDNSTATNQANPPASSETDGSSEGPSEADGPSNDEGPDPSTAPESNDLDAGDTTSSEARPRSERPSQDAPDEAPKEQAAGSLAATDEDIPRVTVRITSDVGEIFGVDERVYELREEDVVTLPEANATPLLDEGAAQRLD